MSLTQNGPFDDSITILEYSKTFHQPEGPALPKASKNLSKPQKLIHFLPVIGDFREFQIQEVPVDGPFGAAILDAGVRKAF